MQFPTVQGSNLERRRFILPADLEGDLNLLLLAFWRHHQALVDTWMPAARDLENQYPGLMVYEVPVLQRRGPLSRWFIDSGMRAGIPDRGTRERTITVYLDKPGFLAALDIRDDHTIRQLLIDRSGEVLWRSAGPHDPATQVELVGFLDQHRRAAS